MLNGIWVALTQSPNPTRWVLDDAEGQRLAETTARVCRWYNVPEVSERWADHYAMFLAIAMIHGARLIAELNDRKHARAADGARVVNPVPQQPGPGPAPSGNGAAPREPPDPRVARTVEVDGVGTIEIPPVTGNMQ